jgi:putative two-component system response regulator
VFVPDVQNGRILVVDDQESQLLLMRKLLKATGYGSVMTTNDPSEAAALYGEFRPDLVILDLHMAPIDGFSVLKQLKELEAESYVPVLMMTASDDPEVLGRAYDAGARDFLRKPFDRVEALARIRGMLEIRLLHNHVREENRRLEEQVRARTKELRETRLEVIHRLGRAAEYRDNETGMHIIRMSVSAACLARAAGMSSQECELLLNASPMHDIGKIGIPDRVLLKPGPLDDSEWAIMRTHPKIGAELLGGSPSELMQMAEEIALCHHEKWDGTGYPRGLRGEEIPLTARVCAVCDVFDALLSKRPYKEKWTVAEALAEIERRKGSHLDPRLVDLFRSILDEILEIQTQYPDPH